MNTAILTNVYNHYLTSYAPKSTNTGKYDTHKKSELRNVYDSIVKLNKESPWYLDTKNRETQIFAIGLKEGARALHNTIASIGGLEDTQSLEQKTAYSSDEEVVTATFTGDAGSSALSPTLTLTVNRLATSQENMGAYLTDERVGLEPDTYSFDVFINDLNYEFQFNINENDTNKDVQERLVRLINNSNLGIQARLDEGDSRSSIRLTSTATGLPEGKQEIFRISDNRTSKAAGAVDYFGLNYISRQPANASFILNGEERTASSNTFTVGKMFELELKSVSEPDTSVSIGLKTDVESLTDNINTLIGSYNSFISAAASYRQSQHLSGRLISEMGRLALHYGADFEQMGLHLQSDSTISIDEERLSETASSTDGSFSHETLKSFTNALLQKTSQVSINPMNYVDRVMVAYKNPNRNFASPYITSAYSGMMFNGYC
ncbi:MAG: flagellar capping protein [Lachnospiraceae bacterium]|nr:flagellar capping protein [Lachnospiraceae bacterium]